MVITRRLFLSFAAQDTPSRDRLIERARAEHLPCSFFEVSIKVPEDAFWQQHCRSKIMQCDALIVLLSEHTVRARGVLWEVGCARKAALPVYALRVVSKETVAELPAELRGIPTYEWSDEKLEELLMSF